ncbi:MAG: xanthine dehydrogenase family protein molybdopterin-binding subunit [Ideonella sp.]
MQMDQPAPRNAIDDNRHGQIGRAADRVDGRLKVTGSAPYAYEVDAGEPAAYGYIVEATIAKGQIERIDSSAAEQATGVLLVLTHHNAPAQAAFTTEGDDRFARPLPCLADAAVRQYGDPVAYVVAETFEQARAAARLVQVDYATQRGAFVLEAQLDKAFKPDSADGAVPDSSTGEFESAFSRAPVQFDETYTTPYQIHAQMEPHASLVWWEGEHVIVHCSTQLIESAHQRVANTLMIDKDQVRIVSRYIGGGFGGKLPVFADVVLGALAARQLQRPIKTALTRQQMFHLTTHRGETRQRLRLGSDPNGRLLAIGHESWSQSTPRFEFCEPAAVATRSLYAAAHRMTRQRSVALDLPAADSCRAPGEAVGLLALESAMDELAHRLDIDPIELRRRNEPDIDPEKQVPFSSRQLLACMDQGAERFGWAARCAQPSQVREGRWLIGIGMSAASRGNLLQESHCEVSLQPGGRLRARMAMTDIGTGSYTVFSQIAAEMLGLPIEQVDMQMGDSDFPASSGSGGSFGAASAGSALYEACENLRAKLAAAAGIDPEQAEFSNGRINGGGHSVALADLAGSSGLSAEGAIKPGAMKEKFSQQAYGAFFAEVAVDTESGEIRLRRMLGVFAAGRILNAKTARSQALGGMIWGVGSALTEAGVVDPRLGFFVNHDLAEYHLPAHADIPAIDAIFLPEVDDKTNPLKIKGVGELGISGAGASVANAVFNACGVRIRDFPLTLDKVLAELPDLA